MPPVTGRRALAFVLACLTACTSPTSRPQSVDAAGPPAVQPAAVRRHAQQFDKELPERVAGSQQEEIAAVYILGHLQRAGYVARLESVPVADAVSSTDVLALPTKGGEPRMVLTVDYDTRRGGPSGGARIGLFLELARALNAGGSRHRVQFAALGAENTERGGGSLGSRRLVRLLLDARADPVVLSIGEVQQGRRIEVRADRDSVVARAWGAAELPGGQRAPVRPLTGEDAFSAAGFQHAVVSGDPDVLGPVLLGFLRSG